MDLLVNGYLEVLYLPLGGGVCVLDTRDRVDSVVALYTPYIPVPHTPVSPIPLATLLLLLPVRG